MIKIKINKKINKIKTNSKSIDQTKNKDEIINELINLNDEDGELNLNNSEEIPIFTLINTKGDIYFIYIQKNSKLMLFIYVAKIGTV